MSHLVTGFRNDSYWSNTLKASDKNFNKGAAHGRSGEHLPYT